MISVDIEAKLPDLDSVESYLTFRAIEEWLSHKPRGRWRFSYSSMICAHGVDIPGRIFFWGEQDAAAFELHFKDVTLNQPVD